MPTPRTRPPTRSDLDHTVHLLQALADLLDAPGMVHLLSGVHTATVTEYASRHGSTEPTSRSSSTSSPTERTATTRPEPVAAEAARLLTALDGIAGTARTLIAGLPLWAAGRPVECCPRCGHPMDRRYNRCQQIEDGRQCGTAADATPCKHCGVDVPKGQIRRGMCDACRKAEARHPGEAVASVRRLRLGENMLRGDGTYSEAG